MADIFRDARIIIVDDEPANVRSLMRILDHAGYTSVIGTADSAEVAELYRRHDPDLVLLDLHMPEFDGLAVLRQLRELTGPLGYMPVLILTGDASSAPRRQALGLGARDFVTKPFEIDEVLLRIHNLLETRFLHQQITAHNRLLEQRVAERTAELDGAYLETLERLAIAAEFRDDETGRHTVRVGEVTARLAVALGLEEGRVALLRLASPLHDVGKIGIPDAVLRKPAALSADERSIMETHTVIGARILSGGRSPIMQLAETIARSHHECWDGTGYPDGTRGEAIPLEARLVSVADVFDALSSDRVYRKAWSIPGVLAYLREWSGRRFDPQIAGLCERPEVERALVAVRLEVAA